MQYDSKKRKAIYKKPKNLATKKKIIAYTMKIMKTLNSCIQIRIINILSTLLNSSLYMERKYRNHFLFPIYFMVRLTFLHCGK